MILLYHDKTVGEAVVLEAPENALANYGRDWSNWPQDLGIYDRPHGLSVWDGEIPEYDGDKWEGTLRDISPNEWCTLKDGCVLNEK